MIWTLLPIIILSFILVPSLILLFLTQPSSTSGITVKVIGSQWYWTYEHQFNLKNNFKRHTTIIESFFENNSLKNYCLPTMSSKTSLVHVYSILQKKFLDAYFHLVDYPRTSFEQNIFKNSDNFYERFAIMGYEICNIKEIYAKKSKKQFLDIYFIYHFFIMNSITFNYNYDNVSLGADAYRSSYPTLVFNCLEDLTYGSKLIDVNSRLWQANTFFNAAELHYVKYLMVSYFDFTSAKNIVPIYQAFDKVIYFFTHEKEVYNDNVVTGFTLRNWYYMVMGRNRHWATLEQELYKFFFRKKFRLMGYLHKFGCYYDYNFKQTSLLVIESNILSSEDLKPGDFRLLEVDQRLILPRNTEIRFLITSTDVLHSWAIPSLGIKVDACPGRLNEIQVFIYRSSVFYGQCSEICGVLHGFMPIVIQTTSLLDYYKYLYSYSDVYYSK